MTTHSRIAAFLSTSALCLGRGGAGGFAADATAKPGETKSQMEHTGKHHKADKTSAKPAAAKPAAAKSDKMDKTDKAGAMTPATTPASRRGPHPQFLQRDSDAAPSPPGNSKASRYGRREAFIPVSRHNRYASTSLARTRCPKRGRAEPASPVRSGALEQPSCQSSLNFRIPTCKTLCHGIEDGQHFSHAGHQCNFLALSQCHQTLIERFDDDVVAHGTQGSHV